MRKFLRFLKKIWILNFIRRVYSASGYFNKKYPEILKWGFNSREFTNFTYDLTDTNMEYLAHTISVVTGEGVEEILRYMHEARDNTLLKDTIIQAVKRMPEGRYADQTVRFGRRLGWYAFARILKPETIVETGVDKGLGSILLCSALMKNNEEGFPGKYYGTEINPEAGYLLTGPFAEFGKILYGDSIRSLSQFRDPIGLFVNDSDHSADYEYREYLAIKHLITDKAIILGDNSHCTDKLALFSRETGREFLYFREEPRDHWYPGAGLGISFKRKSWS
ncbi:MAG TPA: class I SAM-dependent methyltransferase [Cyclobacteriaceae bacterium]|nr:class I SAM-dependent methyltransferase [Cyclobacteriaceae bacterium]